MNIYWLGHSCFLMQTSIGKRILTDPFDVDIGYTPFNGYVDIITISHHHFDHCCTKYFDKNTLIFNELGTYSSESIKIKSFSSFHDNCKGLKRGNNLIFKYEIDGFSICHLGDLGHTLHHQTAKEIGYIDVLFIPVGCNFTLNINDIERVIDLLSPRYIIPMHYKTKKLNFFLSGVDKFLMKMKKYKKVNLCMLTLNKNSIPNESTIIVLDVCNLNKFNI